MEKNKGFVKIIILEKTMCVSHDDGVWFEIPINEGSLWALEHITAPETYCFEITDMRKGKGQRKITKKYTKIKQKD